MREVLGREQLGYAEIEQLRVPFIGDEDIRRFDIAVYDQIAVRIVNRRADRDEQLEAFAYEQRAAVAIRVDGFAIDILHDEVRGPSLQIAAIYEGSDRAMVERGQDVAFAVQTAAQARMHCRVLQN